MEKTIKEQYALEEVIARLLANVKLTKIDGYNVVYHKEYYEVKK